jgi:hypothetical protein
VFENRVLRRMFGAMREEVAGGWRRLHNEELHNLYSLLNTVGMIKSRMRWAGHVTHMGVRCRQYFGWKTWREGPLGRPRRRREDNVRMDHRKMGWGFVDWIHVAQNTTSGGIL